MRASPASSSLTTDQQTQIKPLLVDRQQKMQALLQNQSLSQEDRRAQVRTIAEGTNNSIKALLNDDQKQKFDAMQPTCAATDPADPLPTPRRLLPPTPELANPQQERQGSQDPGACALADLYFDALSINAARSSFNWCSASTFR